MAEIDELIVALNGLAAGLKNMDTSRYTLTGAADWPILMVMGGGLAAIIAFMWVDLRTTIKDHRGEWERHLDKHLADEKEALNLLWDESRAIRKDMKECKEKCCG